MVDVDETIVLLIAFFVLLVPFPLISIGTTEDVPSLWWLGVALIVVGGSIPPIARYVFDERDGNGSNNDADTV